MIRWCRETKFEKVEFLLAVEDLCYSEKRMGKESDTEGELLHLLFIRKNTSLCQ